jgi:PEP-CTERM motif
MRKCKREAMALTFGAGLALAASAIAASATTVLTDGDFTNVTATSTYSADAGTQISISAPCPSCGNSGPALQTVLDYTNATSNGSPAGVGYVDNLLSYDPATMGAIASISASYDRMFTVAGTESFISYTFRALIEQNGNYYVTSAATSIPPFHFTSTTPTDGWVNLAVSGLVASDFSSFDFATGIAGTSHPDFAGAPMLFGIQVGSISIIGQILTTNYDNLSFTVSQTPLPAALPLFASGLGALGLLGWRRKRKTSAAIG